MPKITPPRAPRVGSSFRATNRIGRRLQRAGSPQNAGYLSLEAVKSQFFDRNVDGAINRAEKKTLGRIGALIRRDAKRSMKRTRSTRTPPSPKGHPPRSRKGHLRKFLFYWYDDVAHDVIVGPIRLPRTKVALPGVHEKGGMVPRRVQRNAQYPARPYMVPALKKNLRKGLKLWKNTVSR